MLEGTNIGSYRVVRQLGEGGMGAVYLGEHALLGRRVAIKVLLPTLSAHEEFVRRFFNEAKMVTQIADPGIVQVFDFGHHTDGSAYIIMELLEGDPMDRRLERLGRIAPLDCLRLMRQICSSLAAAHAKGIIHRDLKPENIFIVGDVAVTGAERTKLLDFGIAKLLGDAPNKHKTRTGMVMGTPVYMSPEQCRGTGDIDARSDIYAIGCVMMTMLTGRPPFEADGSGDLIIAHVCHPPPLAVSRVFGLPALFDEILQRCLAKSPADRFQSMTDLARTLGVAEQMVMRSSEETMFHETPAYVASGLTPPPRPTPTPTPTPTTMTRAAGQVALPAAPRRRGWTIAVTAALGIAGAVAFVSLRRHTAPATVASPVAAPALIDAGRPDAPPDAPPDAAVVQAAADASVPVDAPADAARVIIAPPRRQPPRRVAPAPTPHVELVAPEPDPGAGSAVAPSNRGD